MNKMKFLTNGWQSARLGLDVARIIRSQNLTAEEMRKIRDNKTFLVDYTEKMVSRLLDPWDEEKRKISLFFQTCFKQDVCKNINWNQIAIPMIEGDLKRLDFFPVERMNEDDVLEAYCNYFGKTKILKEWKNNLSEIINYSTVQDRPKKNYVGLYSDECGPNILGKNYDDAVEEGITCMTPFEYLISAFRHYFEMGLIHETKGDILLGARNKFGYAMSAFIKNGILKIVSCSRMDRDPENGLRRIKIEQF